MSLRQTLCVTLCLFASVACHSQQSAPSGSNNEAVHRADVGIQALQQWYVPETGLYRTTGWWNAANVITALADYMRISGSRQFTTVLATTHTQAQITVPKEQRVGSLEKMTGFPGFLNKYYDDEGWWALAWIDAYDLTRDGRYLASAQSIFDDMADAWDNTCGGGIWWSKDRNYKNAIANELFFSVAAHLATRVPASRQRYADWAAKEWKWFGVSGMINERHLVNDGLVIDEAAGTCRNNGRTVWTYNQGVLLGALAEWSQTPSNSGVLRNARLIADASLTNLTDKDGILHDTCEPNCNPDGVQFKGIFMRNLRALDAVVHDPRYRAAFTRNADSIWTRNKTPENQFGEVWSGPPGTPRAGSHSSALDALIAAIPDRK
jgi:predicted alpha-1,6-mannanase (GH76 family)